MDLDRLNSATKYPSILTYHEMGDRGRLSETVQVSFPAGQKLFVTEKVDGTNGRIVFLPDGPRKYLIGSREEFLTAQGDLIPNPTYGIVKALEDLAVRSGAVEDSVQVLFLEVFGGDLPAAKQYSAQKGVGLRLFDSAFVPLDILDQPRDKIAHWRDHGGQVFRTTEDLELLAAGLSVAPVPALATVDTLPTGVKDTYDWLKSFQKSRVDLGGGLGRSEGVVVRTADRKTIAKLRFEDYERTLGIKKGA